MFIYYIYTNQQVIGHKFAHQFNTPTSPIAILRPREDDPQRSLSDDHYQVR